MANASKKLREGRRAAQKPKPGAESDTKKGEIRVQPGGRGRASAVSEKQRNTVRGKRTVRSRKVSQDRVRSGQGRVG